MKKKSFLLFLPSFAFVVGWSTAAAQSRAIIVEQPKPIWSSAAQFSDVSSARAFGDGSLLIADPGGKGVFHISAQGTAIRAIGRIGSGPAEYRAPQSVQFFPDGLTLLTDPALRRFLVLDSLGQAIRTMQFALSANGLSGRLVSDHVGGIYYSAISQNPLLAREVGLFRLNIATGKSDSIASLLGIQLADVSMPPSNAQRQPMRSYMVVPFAPRDGYASFPNGDVVVVRSLAKRVDWLDVSGKRIASKPLPSPTDVAVSDADLERVRPIALRKLVPRRQLDVDVDFMVAGDNGDVWLPRITTRASTATEWLVMTRGVGAMRAVRVPSRARLLAVVGKDLFVTEVSVDDLERITLYRTKD